MEALTAKEEARYFGRLKNLATIADRLKGANQPLYLRWLDF